MRAPIGLFGVLLFVVSAGPAGAATISVSLTGTIHEVSGPVPSPPPFAVGDPASVSFEIDSTTPDSVPGDPIVGSYAGAVSNLSFSFGGYTGAGMGDGHLDVLNNYGFYAADVFGAGFSAAGDEVGGIPPNGLGVQLADTTATAFSDDAIPASLDLADFDRSNQFFLVFSAAPPVYPYTVVATVNSVRYTVPEPGTLLLLVLGAAVGRRRTWRHLRPARRGLRA